MKKIAFLFMLAGILTTACLFEGSDDTDRSLIVLGHVEDKPITALEMDSLADMGGLVITDTTDVEAIKDTYINSLVDGKIVELLQDSLAVSLDNDFDFNENRNREVANTVFRLMFEGEISAKVNIDSAEIAGYYEDNHEMYKVGKQIKASHILIPPPKPDTAGVKSEKKKASIIDKNDRETLERAQAVYEKAKAGENWDSLVVKYSQDNMTKDKGGDLGYFTKGRMVPEFDSVAFATPVGEVSKPVKTRYGYHIIKVIDNMDEHYRELNEQLITEIRGQLRGKKEKELADKFLDSLKAEAAYEFNEEALAQEDSLLEERLWVVVVNQSDTVFESQMQRDFPKYMRFHQLTEWTVDNKKDMLRDVAVNFLLRAAGKKLGYYDTPKAIEAYEGVTQREAKMRATNQLRDLEYKPSYEEIEKYYNDNFEGLYREKKPYHVQHIIFEDSVLAATIADSLRNGADFKEMALEYYPGEPEIREVAYDLGYISEDELGQDFFNHVKEMKKDEISAPFKTEWGYHVVKLVNKREDKKIDQVQPAIRKALMGAADNVIKQAYIEEKRNKVAINIDHGAVKKYKFPERFHANEIIP